MACSLGLFIMQPQPEMNDSVYGIVQGDVSTPVVLPSPPVLVQRAKSSWAKPALGFISWLDHMYRFQEAGAEFLFYHP